MIIGPHGDPAWPNTPGRESAVGECCNAPDRLVLGKSAAVTLELIQALNTGHRGCLGTVHANTAFSATRRLEMLLLLTGLDWPIDAIQNKLPEQLI